MADAERPTNKQIVDLLEQALRRMNDLAEGQRRIADDLRRIKTLGGD